MLAVLIFPLVAFAPQGDADQVRVRSGHYAPPEAAITVQSSPVELAVTVRNPKGNAVGGFKAGDFELFDNKKPQRITFFEERRAVQTAAVPAAVPAPVPGMLDRPDAIVPAGQNVEPRTIAWFFDDNRGGVLIGRSKVAAQKLVGNLRETDTVGIFTAPASVSVNFTRDKKALLGAIAKIAPHPLPGERGFMSCPMLTAYQAHVIREHIDLGAPTRWRSPRPRPA